MDLGFRNRQAVVGFHDAVSLASVRRTRHYYRNRRFIEMERKASEKSSDALV